MKSPLALLLSGLAACSSSPSSPALDEARLDLAGPCVVALDTESRPIASVGLGLGRPRRFLLDSGCSISLIDGRCVDELGLERRPYPSPFDMTGSGGRSIEVDEFVLVHRLELGALTVHATHITLMDDPVLAQAGIDGILGQDLLARLVLVFDMQRDVVHILPRGSADEVRAYLATADVGDGAWAMTPLDFRPCPFVSLDVAGSAQSIELEVDTGAGDTSLPGATIEALGLESIGLRMSGAVGGNFTAKLYRLDDFELFGSKVSLSVTAAPTEYGLLGMDVLGEMVFVLDGPRRTMWMHHGK